MFPAGGEAKALFRPVSDRTRDGAQIGPLDPDIHRHHARLVSLRRADFARSDRDRGDQSRGRDRPAQVEFEAALVDVARIEARDGGEVIAGEEILVAAGNRAEDIFPAGGDRHGQIALVAIVIDQQLRLVDRGEGIAEFAQRGVEVEPFGLDPVALHRIARLDLERPPQDIRIARRTERAQVDRPEAIALAGDDIEAHGRARRIGIVGSACGAAGSDGARDPTIVEPVDPQQFGQQFLVLARTGGQLCDVLVVAVEFLDGRKRFEPFDEIAAFGEGRVELGEAERQRIVQSHQISFGKGDLGARDLEIGELDILFGEVDVERRKLEIVGPFDCKVGQVRERRFGIEVGAVSPELLLRRVITRIGTVARPALGIIDRAVGDQVFQFRIGRLTLRRERRGECDSGHCERRHGNRDGTARGQEPRRQPVRWALLGEEIDVSRRSRSARIRSDRRERHPCRHAPQAGRPCGPSSATQWRRR